MKFDPHPITHEDYSCCDGGARGGGSRDETRSDAADEREESKRTSQRP